MFFFFFWDTSFEVIRKCLLYFITEDIESKYYCDLSVLFSDALTKKVVLSSVVPHSDKLDKLYKKRFPKNREDLLAVSEIYGETAVYHIWSQKDAFAVLFWCFKYFKNGKPFEKHEDEIMEELMTFLHNELKQYNFARLNSIVYDETQVILHHIETLGDYLKVLNKYSEEDILFYRGHSSTTYYLCPSILRSENLKRHENAVYQELVITCPNEFKNYKRHIDYLVKMQHYGLPTRLLDITRNPLVALYFTCCSNSNKVGEVIVFAPKPDQVKYENSDTVAMIASLPLFSYEDQVELIDCLYVSKPDYYNNDHSTGQIIERFIHEIQTEKPGFFNRINRDDLTNCYIVLPKKDNNRIVKQDGAFIICGINEHPDKLINQNLHLSKKGKPVLLFVTNKKEILKELDLLSINKSTLFPEIDYVSEYIKSKYDE